jgi:DNA-binding response OmpR family regulator
LRSLNVRTIIDLAMRLDDAAYHPTEAPLAEPGGGPRCAPRGASATASLLLFVGADFHPGAAVLIELNAALQCPLIVVAGRPDEVDEIVALEYGAAAYLAQPLAPRRLRAHLAALMRERTAAPYFDAAAAQAPSPLPQCGWQLDRIANRLRRAESDGSGERLVALTEVQSALLQCLIEAQGLIVPRARLAAALPNRHEIGARSVDVYIHRLRQRLHGEGVEGLAIQAVRGRGYRLATLEAAAPERVIN